MTSLELLALVLERLPSQPNGWVVCTRTELCRKLCHHPNRPGSLRTEDLDCFVPRLIAAGLACECPRLGKPPALVFRPVSRKEFKLRLEELEEIRAEVPWAPSDPVARQARHARCNRELSVWRKLGPKGSDPYLNDELMRPVQAEFRQTPVEIKAAIPVPDMSLKSGVKPPD